MKNLFIFVADSLRWDYLPESIRKEGSAVRTLAPSLHTPTSFSSMVTGRSAENHNVRGFGDRLSESFETVFDRFENGSYYDHPEDPMRSNVFKHLPEKKELSEVETPFVMVERAMESHEPYNEINHGNEMPDKSTNDYIGSFDSVNELEKAYRKGVEGVEKHFWNHVRELEERGLREDTLIVFTSDHGEFLGERINFKRRYTHNNPMARQLVDVPTVFLSQEIDTEYMRLIDLVETSLAMMGKKPLGQDGVDIREESPKIGRAIFDGYTSYDNKWVFRNGRWSSGNNLKLKYDILREDFRALLNNRLSRDFIPRPGKKKVFAETSGIDF